MKKLLIVFCLVTMLTLLFACNGVPALAATDDANNDAATPAAIEQQAIDKNVTKNTSRPKKAKKSTKKAKKNNKAFDVMNYFKKGKFDWKAYGKAIGSTRVILHNTNVNLMLPGGCCITITSDAVDGKDDNLVGKYLLIIYNLVVDYDEPEVTFFFESEDWGLKFETKDGGHVSSVGLEYAYKVAKYLSKDPEVYKYKKPNLKGVDWREGSEIVEYDG
jgi:lipoprotein